MHRHFLIVLLLFFSQLSIGQYKTAETTLLKKIEGSHDEAAKIRALGELAEFYYIYRAEEKADSVLQKQLLLAELSNNKQLIIDALFGNAIENVSTWTSTETYDKALAFLDKGLSYAREMQREDYQVIAHIRKAVILRKRGQFDNAVNEATLAFGILDHLEEDSLKAVLYAELGDIFLAKGEAVSAYKNFNKSFSIAYDIKNVALQSRVFHHLSALYQSLGNGEMAKKNLLKSLDLNILNNNKPGLLVDYIDLARLTDEKDYIDKALLLADTLNARRYLLFGKRIMLSYLMVIKKSSAEALSYLYSNSDLTQSYLNSGLHYYYWNIGNIYRYSNQYDSAIYYYSLAEPALYNSFDVSLRRTVLKSLGECYWAVENLPQAQTYFEKTLVLSRELNDFSSNASLTLQLSQLFARTGNYQKAYEFNKEYIGFKDTLSEMAAQREVVLLEVDRENKRYEKDMEDKAAQVRQTRNIQYMGISVAIAIFFLGLILMGMFPISKFTIRMLSFFAFICLFEFFVLLIDSYLHHITHGEPLKIWLIKIFIIAMLVPLQHFLEHGVVKFLESQKLLKLRQQFSAKKIWQNIKKPAPVKQEADFEKDTAVL